MQGMCETINFTSNEIMYLCVQLAAARIFFFGGNSMISSLAFGVWLCSIHVFIINVFACPFNVCSAVLLCFQLLVATIMITEARLKDFQCVATFPVLR